MIDIANLKTTLGTPLSILSLVSSGKTTHTPGSGAPFDCLHIENANSSPQTLPALFHSHERNLGNPARLFPEWTEGEPKAGDMKRAQFDWLGVLDSVKPYCLRAQITAINCYLNRSADTETLAKLGRKLPWARPLRVFHNAGSEHIAFAKYLSLRKVHVNADRLRLVWVEDRCERNNRVVLAITLAGRNYILDNRCPEIIEDDTLQHFRPYCSTCKTQFSLHWDKREDKGWETSLKQLGSHALH